jgi:hypothetical protein
MNYHRKQTSQVMHFFFLASRQIRGTTSLPPPWDYRQSTVKGTGHQIHEKYVYVRT